MAGDHKEDDAHGGGARGGGEALYVAELGQLSDSGVSGLALVSTDGDTLTTQIVATGLEPGQPHPQHIHGRSADTDEGPSTGGPIDSVSPNLLSDDDGDGFIELEEGLDTYGEILVSLTSPPGGEVADFPTAPDGFVLFEETYDLSDESVFAEGFDANDLTPLDFREIVLHGRTVAEGEGEGTPGEVNGDGGYLAVLPVAAGELRSLETDGSGADLRAALANATETGDGISLALDDGSEVTLPGLTVDQAHELAATDDMIA